jgi:nitrogen fixation protein FixH
MTPSSAPRADARAARWIPRAFIAGFAVVIAVNAALIWFAVGSFSGLSEAHAYQAGLAYNRTLAAAKAQERLGWTAELTVRPATEPGAVRVIVALADRDGSPISGESVEAEFLRPAAAGHDRRAVFAPVGPGRYASTVALPLRGLWEVRLLVRRGGESWQATQRIVLP